MPACAKHMEYGMLCGYRGTSDYRIEQKRKKSEKNASLNDRTENVMTKREFLVQLQEALQDRISSRQVQENLEYYEHYIIEETGKGKTEEEVLRVLGDPWILARTITDASDGTDRETVYEAEGIRSSSGERQRSRQEESAASGYGGTPWWKKLLLVLFVLMILMLIGAIISGLVRVFAPILVPVLVVMVFVRVWGNRHR